MLARPFEFVATALWTGFNHSEVSGHCCALLSVLFLGLFKGKPQWEPQTWRRLPAFDTKVDSDCVYACMSSEMVSHFGKAMFPVAQWFFFLTVGFL